MCFVNFDLEMCFAPQRRATFSSLIWPDGSAPAALASLLFDPPEPQTIGKTQWEFPFFDLPSSSLSLLVSSRLFSSLLFPDFSHLCVSSVHIVGSLTSKLPSIIAVRRLRWLKQIGEHKAAIIRCCLCVIRKVDCVPALEEEGLAGRSDVGTKFAQLGAEAHDCCIFKAWVASSGPAWLRYIAMSRWVIELLWLRIIPLACNWQGFGEIPKNGLRRWDEQVVMWYTKPITNQSINQSFGCNFTIIRAMKATKPPWWNCQLLGIHYRNDMWGMGQI